MRLNNKLVEKVTVNAVITRADGTTEDLGEVYEYLPWYTSLKYFIERVKNDCQRWKSHYYESLKRLWY